MNGVGGDTAEDVLGGLKVALREIKWRPGGTKVESVKSVLFIDYYLESRWELSTLAN